MARILRFSSHISTNFLLHFAVCVYFFSTSFPFLCRLNVTETSQRKWSESILFVMLKFKGSGSRIKEQQAKTTKINKKFQKKTLKKH